MEKSECGSRRQGRGLLASKCARRARRAADRSRGCQSLFQKGRISGHMLNIRRSLTRTQMNRFFIYEEYGAKYELMIKDVASAHRTMPKWQSYQRGLEVLASSLGSANSFDDSAKKSLTIGDLLVKVRLLSVWRRSRLTRDSPFNESASTRCCLRSFSSTRRSWIAPTLTWRSKTRLSGFVKRLPRSTGPLTMRGSNRCWKRHGSFRTVLYFPTRLGSREPL